ncbi:MAG: MBOAT family protein [Lachnospiraceae bacterium]|nr:MBOAT family protein [Lachnospiraceae bacterium]
MIFSSLLFLFWFIPIFFTVYYLVPQRYKNPVLFIFSVIFYGFGEPKYLLLIFLSITVNYFAGILMDKTSENKALRTTVFVLCIVFDIGMLMFFKYINFFIENINALTGLKLSAVNITLPLGISFYTFQIMSYVIDLYRGKTVAQKSILKLGTYLIMFPQLIAGPIVVYSRVSDALDERRIKPEEIEEGVRIFIIGLASKVLLANNIGMLWEELKTVGYGNISTLLAWLGALSFTLQIYFDFNGYSLMAIGIGKMLGFEFPLNFDLPYTSASVTEFWRRWHITLSSWFREYVYIPLGGNRKGRLRTYINLFIVWFLTGFWHGAGWNFILWGLYFFVLLSLEKLFLKNILIKSRIFARLYTGIAVIVSWVIFAITDMGDILKYIGRMFSINTGNDIVYYLGNYAVVMAIGCAVSLGYVKKLYDKVNNRYIKMAAGVILFVISVAYLADEGYNPFLYFRF